MVETVQKHFRQVIHGLPVPGWQLRKFVQDKVGDPLGDAGFLEGRVTQWALHHGLAQLQDALAEQFEEVEVDLLRVRVLFLVHAHEQVFHVDHDAQQSVQLCIR